MLQSGKPILRITPPGSRSTSPITTPTTRRHTNVTRDRIRSWWVWEAWCWSLSTGCLCAIVGLLIRYHGRQLHHWPYSITLNSMLAILSAISKSAFIVPASAAISQLKWARMNKKHSLLDLQKFDNASRGPLGSLLLMFRYGL